MEASTGCTTGGGGLDIGNYEYLIHLLRGTDRVTPVTSKVSRAPVVVHLVGVLPHGPYGWGNFGGSHIQKSQETVKTDDLSPLAVMTARCANGFWIQLLISYCFPIRHTSSKALKSQNNNKSMTAFPQFIFVTFLLVVVCLTTTTLAVNQTYPIDQVFVINRVLSDTSAVSETFVWTRDRQNLSV